MTDIKIVSLILMFSLNSCVPKREESSQVKFYGKDSDRAAMRFHSYMHYKIPKDYSGKPENLKKSNKYWEQAKILVDEQLAHMYGVFTQHDGYWESPGIPRNRPQIKFGIVEPIPSKPGYVKINYQYDDVVVFKSDRFKRGNEDGIVKQISIKFVLPIDPLTIYASGFSDKKREKGCINRCTDLHYNGLGDHWYFWNPYQIEAAHKKDYPDCKPLRGKRHCPYHPVKFPKKFKEVTVPVTAYLRHLRSTRIRFPDYDELYADGKLTITYLVGIDEVMKDKCDLGVRSYFEAIKRLTVKNPGHYVTTGLGPEERKECEKRDVYTAIDVAEVSGFEIVKNTARDKILKKVFIDYDGTSTNPEELKKIEVILRIVLVDPDNEGFVDLSMAAMQGDHANGIEPSDIFIYDGHSGLGGYLSTERFEDHIVRKFKLPKKKNQVFYFNGCSTYSYYNADYIDVKKSAKELSDDLLDVAQDKSRYLDIVTTGIGAAFAVGAMHDVSFINNFTSGKRPSWQTILDDIYNTMPDYSALTHINGEGDNPTHGHRPQRKKNK